MNFTRVHLIPNCLITNQIHELVSLGFGIISDNLPTMLRWEIWEASSWKEDTRHRECASHARVTINKNTKIHSHNLQQIVNKFTADGALDENECYLQGSLSWWKRLCLIMEIWLSQMRHLHQIHLLSPEIEPRNLLWRQRHSIRFAANTRFKLAIRSQIVPFSN